MTAPLVSCVVPAYNGERYLRQALDSLHAQTHGSLEVIVVDDGSTDGTAAMAREYGPPVRLVQQANAGPAAAINRGFEEVQGEYVGVLAASRSEYLALLKRSLDQKRRWEAT